MITHVLYTCTKGKVILLSRLSKKLEAHGVRGASVSNLSRIFQGRHEAGYPLMKALAIVLDMPIEEVDELIKTCRERYQEVQKGLKEDIPGDVSETEGGGGFTQSLT